MCLHPQGSHCVVLFLFLVTTRPLPKSVSQISRCTIVFRVNVVLGGNTDKQVQQHKHQDTKILSIHLLTSRSSQISLGFQEKFRHQVFPIMSRPVVSAGEVGPDPILHQQEN